MFSQRLIFPILLRLYSFLTVFFHTTFVVFIEYRWFSLACLLLCLIIRLLKCSSRIVIRYNVKLYAHKCKHTWMILINRHKLYGGTFKTLSSLQLVWHYVFHSHYTGQAINTLNTVYEPIRLYTSLHPTSRTLHIITGSWLHQHVSPLSAPILFQYLLVSTSLVSSSTWFFAVVRRRVWQNDTKSHAVTSLSSCWP